MARTLSLTDVLMPESLISLFVALISAKQSVQSYAAKILFELALQPYAKVTPHTADSLDQSVYALKPALEMVAVWVMGEYGYKLIEREELSAEEVINSLQTILQLSVRNTYDEGMKREVLLGGSVHSSSSLLREVALSCLAKLYMRVVLPRATQELVLDTLRFYQTSLDLEVQQRACEYFQVMDEKWKAFSKKIMAPLPPMDYNALRKKQLRGSDTAPGADPRKELSESLVSLLMDDEEEHNEPTQVQLSNWDDLVLENNAQSSRNISDHDLDGLLFSTSFTDKQTKEVSATRTMECGEHLSAELHFVKETSLNFKVEFHFRGIVEEPLKHFRLQIAVPKVIVVVVLPHKEIYLLS